jgi:glycosyltransferase involved in cell wall biosynthesis
LVHAVRQDVTFLIVGNGSPEHTRQIQADIARRGLQYTVRMIGWWPDEIHGLLAGLDLLIISSVLESFGLTAVEALAVGTPVVSTRCGGPTEIIRNDVDGRLVAVGDAGGMSSAIVDLLADSVKARALGRAGRTNVLKRFAVEQYVRDLEAELIAAVGRGHGDTRSGPEQWDAGPATDKVGTTRETPPESRGRFP